MYSDLEFNFGESMKNSWLRFSWSCYVYIKKTKENGSKVLTLTAFYSTLNWYHREPREIIVTGILNKRGRTSWDKISVLLCWRVITSLIISILLA